MAITGTHMLFYTSQPEKLRAVLRDVFGFQYVDAGGGWLIFDLPPSEIGVHPAEGPTYASGMRHQITFMCDDIHRTIAQLRGQGVTVDGEPKDEGYGIITTLKLPGECDVTLYQPRHAIAAGITKAKAAGRSSAARKAANTKRAVKAGGARSASVKKRPREKPG